jgi:hypothetical protein
MQYVTARHLDQVVAEVGNRTACRAHGPRCALCYHAPVQRRPAHGGVVLAKIGTARPARGVEMHRARGQLPLQDREAKSTRAGMHKQINLGRIEPGFGGCLRHQDLFDRLQLAEVVAAADGAERRIERGRRKTGFGHRVRDAALPRRIERTQAACRLVDAQLAYGKVELEQAHAATDVGANEQRVDPIRQNTAAHGAVLSRMQVRHAGNGFDAGQRCDIIQLLRGVALDPGTGRVEGVDRRAAAHGR